MNTSLIARDSVGHPALGVMQQEGFEGPDVLYHAYMLSWECIKAAKKGLLTGATVLAQAQSHYDALKKLHLESAHRIAKSGNVMPIHPRAFLDEIINNHIIAAKHFGYWNIIT